MSQITLKISVIERIALRDFKGLEKCDLSTRKMVLDFSLNVAQGNMDHAFRFLYIYKKKVLNSIINIYRLKVYTFVTIRSCLV